MSVLLRAGAFGGLTTFGLGLMTIFWDLSLFPHQMSHAPTAMSRSAPGRGLLPL